MTYKKLECIVLVRDIPGHDLRTGDMGAVVEVYPGGGVEVEFVTGSGETLALLTLDDSDVRRVDSRDLLATRRLTRARS
jgi:hypothetical protein